MQTIGEVERARERGVDRCETGHEGDLTREAQGDEVLAGIVSGSPIPPYASTVRVQRHSSPYRRHAVRQSNMDFQMEE